MVEGLEAREESWDDYWLSGTAMDVACGLVLARRECWRWRGGSDLPQRRRLQKNEESRKHPWQVAETLLAREGSFANRSWQRLAQLRTESAEGAGLGVPLPLAIQLFLFIPQLQLQSDWGEEGLQVFKEVLFRHANIPVKKEQ